MGLFKKKVGVDKFTYNIQLAHFENDYSEDKGETYLSHFQAEYDNFPWIEELNKENIKTSPTMTVEDHFKNLKLALSIVFHSGEDKAFHIFHIKGRKVKMLENVVESKAKKIIVDFFDRQNVLKEYF